MSRFLVFLLVALLARESFQRGTLYLNEIQALEDPITGEQILPIECTIWEDNYVYLDEFNSLSSPGIPEGVGVDVDGALLNGGTWVFPNDFNVAGTVTINGLLKVNGGFFADDGDFGDADGDDLDWAFELVDDFGNAFISGRLDIDEGGITNSKPLTNPDGTFNVANDGETTVSGLIRPNGGININNGVITVSPDGEFFVDGDAVIENDIILGTPENNFFDFIPYTNGPGSVPANGGDTILKGQDAASEGGHILLAAGTGVGASADTQQTGSIVVGLEAVAHDLNIGRFAANSGNAGDFVIGGQTSYGNGGDILLEAGSAENVGRGGDVIFSPGVAGSNNDGNGIRGFLYLGDPSDGSNIPFYVERPAVVNADQAGHTFITGQNVTAGAAGSTVIAGGDGSSRGGNIYLEPGTNGNRQGKVFFGSQLDSGTTLNIARVADTASVTLNGGETWFIGQDSLGGDGGDIFLEAGRGSATSCGDLYLSPGANTANTGIIYWGTNDNNPNLRIMRPPSADNPAHDTIFAGVPTSSGAIPGGNFLLLGGNGNAGGDVHLQAGFGEEDYGGEVVIQSGSGQTDGDITISSGVSASQVTGNIFITAGDGGFGGDAGSVFISAEDTITFTSNELLLDSIPFFVDANELPVNPILLTSTVTGNTLEITPVPAGFFQLNAGAGTELLLTDRIPISGLTFRSEFVSNPQDIDQIVQAATDFQTTLANLRTGLISHGLIVEV